MRYRTLRAATATAALSLASIVTDSVPLAYAQDSTDPSSEARQALARLRREADQCGVKLSQSAQPGAPDGFRVVMQASPFQLALFADAGPWLSPLPTASGPTYAGNAVPFPDVYSGALLRVEKRGTAKPTTSADDYFARLLQLGSGASALPAHLARTAELVVYTLDGDGNGAVDPADKQTPEALGTARPDDVALYRVVYGTEIVDGKPTARQSKEVVAHGIRVWLEPGDQLGANDKPGPVFTYRLSEPLARFDLNGDGDTQDEILFGDSNGDGQLDASESEALVHSNTKPKTDLVDNLDVDARLAASQSGQARAGLLARLHRQHPNFTDAQTRQLLHNSIARVDVSLLLEYDIDGGKRRIRRQLRGRAALRNRVMRLLGMTP